MLTITIPDVDLFNDETQEFIILKGATLQLEHSLVSVSKWESKWKKAFLGKDQKTQEEVIDYIKCMTITKNVNQDLYNYIPIDTVKEISNYIEDPMTATWFSDNKQKGSSGGGEVITSELIYYWMIALQIPVEFQRWHLNRLLTLIRVCDVKNTPPKKMSKREIMNRNKALNESRRKKLGTNG